eukprot:CAMPEP_0113965310 /NCGR_PEP_ID=MMETSP0011_2-20120614/7670_1 /TAXON_ID=101924 /ORGANISM="Rhodosorus marinus" /LENGTH=367 /DNA_ID=CAMNT_0000977801 /DNA_START=296 /DNA_END=1399 /DNA_ORIENTATION=+ /assembly_acc=CAM_ASM_000156
MADTPQDNLEVADEEKGDVNDYWKRQVEQVFYPYVRKSPSWNIYEIIKTTLMTVFVLPLRVILVILFAVVTYSVAKVALLGEDEERPVPYSAWKKFMLRSISPLIRAALFCCFGVYYIEQTKHEDERPAYVIVSNHTGYIDILILCAMYRGGFVAKGSVKNARLVGTIARALQCLFVVEGESLTDTLKTRIVSTYECHLKKGCGGCPTCFRNIVIFPEGTTTNGYGMVPMRTGVFVPGLPVKPVAIRFPHRHFNLSWETIYLKEHIWRTMTQFRNYAELVECPTYVPTEEDIQNPREFARHVQESLNEVLDLPVYPLGRKHKFAYHKYVLGLKTGEEALEEAKELTEKDELLVEVSKRQAAAGKLCP